LFGEKDHPSLHELWIGADKRLSSDLLKIECIIAIRRAAVLQKLAADEMWTQERLDMLAVFDRGIDSDQPQTCRLSDA
jgi:hypothetical protein